jgi:hypothetical protein
MSEQMPARIWVKPFAIRSSDIEVKNAVISSLSARSVISAWKELR